MVADSIILLRQFFSILRTENNIVRNLCGWTNWCHWEHSLIMYMKIQLHEALKENNSMSIVFLAICMIEIGQTNSPFIIVNSIQNTFKTHQGFVVVSISCSSNEQLEALSPRQGHYNRKGGTCNQKGRCSISQWYHTIRRSTARSVSLVSRCMRKWSFGPIIWR